jgi:hypothetical protein
MIRWAFRSIHSDHLGLVSVLRFALDPVFDFLSNRRDATA